VKRVNVQPAETACFARAKPCLIAPLRAAWP
jgi:hypothetical protein